MGPTPSCTTSAETTPEAAPIPEHGTLLSRDPPRHGPAGQGLHHGRCHRAAGGVAATALALAGPVSLAGGGQQLRRRR